MAKDGEKATIDCAKRRLQRKKEARLPLGEPGS
jgi:hypothetical protein